MAEPHDLVERPAAEPPLPTANALAPDPAAPAEQAYRSLSLLALLGFGVAALYAGAVVLLGLVGLFGGRPLLLSLWTLLFPLAGLGLCLVARFRVARSEGTLAGGSLAGWGVTLSLFVGLGYCAYYAAVFFALRQQAQGFARHWLDLLKEGKVEQAAYFTLAPLKRRSMTPEDKDLAQKLTMRQGSQEGGGGGGSVLSQVRQDTLVRMITEGGPETTFEPRGVRSWDFAKGGYQVTLSFRVHTPEISFDALVTVHGSEAPHKEYQGRQWSVDLGPGMTGINADEGPPELTPLGEALSRLNRGAADFMPQWVQSLRGGEPRRAFPLTLPEEERDRARDALRRAEPLGALAGGVPTAGAAGPGLLARYHRFLRGGVVDADPAGFPDEETRSTILAAVRNAFAVPGSPLLRQTEPARTVPTRRREGDKVLFGFDFRLSDGMTFRAVATLLLEADARAVDAPEHPARWRVAGFRLTSGQMRPAHEGPEAPAPRPPPAPPGRP